MKWILWISIALVGVLILITLIGWLLPKAHSVSREVQFREPPEAIWKAITDIEAMPAWRQGLKSVKHLPDKNGLPSWVETSASGTIPFETVVSQPPAKLIVRIADPKLPFGGTWTYQITPVAAGSSLRIRRRRGSVQSCFSLPVAICVWLFRHNGHLPEIARKKAC